MLLKKSDGPLSRDVYCLSVSTAERLAAAISIPHGSHFVLFLAWDARDAPDENVVGVARALLTHGLCYIVAWGPDCERVHDLFDKAGIELRPEWNEPGGDTVLMSTWHDNEPLEEALWFALNSAYPTSPYDQTVVATVAATIGNSAWASAVDSYLSDLASLNRAVGLS